MNVIESFVLVNNVHVTESMSSLNSMINIQQSQVNIKTMTFKDITAEHPILDISDSDTLIEDSNFSSFSA